jgi:hypothetical protein
MANERSIEERLAALEEAVAAIQRRLENQAPVPPGFERMVGAITDLEGFEQVLEYGRAIRQADRPPDEEDATP